jgi:alkanesulfonate monooxygenase SsuD/methylene tetrahydromethanopterin reductase-like flavin-dependent oxidoreductase (luciferase family)
MLRAALPHADAWNAWYTDTANRADGARSQSQRVDALCIEVGRGPGSVERTVAVLVRPTFEGRPPDTSPYDGVVPLSGTAEEIAAGLLAYAAAGIGHVQLVLNPITPARIAALAPVLESLDRAEGLDRAARSG